MTTLEILKKARELLAEGWCQGQGIAIREGIVYKRDICNALNDAAGGGGGLSALGGVEEREAFTIVWDATGGEGIINFNDTPGRTLDEVLYVMDTCIYTLETHELETASVKPE